MAGVVPRRLRSWEWFRNSEREDLTELYVARYRNFGMSRLELQSGRPVVGIAQTGSDLTPCNRHHLDLASRVKDGIREAGGLPLEFPLHPIQETSRRPCAALDRNLAYLGLVEVMNGYPLDGVVLTTGCDKTTPAALMAAATMDLPAIVLSGGPMLNGWHKGQRVGSGTVFFKARAMLADGQLTDREYQELLAASAPSIGHCNTMGTALTMNSIAEALGMSLPGCATIPAPDRERREMAYFTGRRIVEMVLDDLRPSAILTPEAFANAIAVCSAIGGSTNAPVHLIAMAKHAGVPLSMSDWRDIGEGVPLLANVMPAGEYLAEDFHRAGGVQAVMNALLAAGHVDGTARCVNGRSIEENCRDRVAVDEGVIRNVQDPLLVSGGFAVLTGNLFDSALMKLSGMSEQFRQRYLSNPQDPQAFECRAVIFESPEDYSARIDDPELGVDEDCILVMRGVGPVAFPGSGEVVNMRPPKYLLDAGVDALPCLGDGRQSGTSGAPSILNASPEAAVGGRLGLLKDGDRVRVDLMAHRVDVLLSEAELEEREAAAGEPSRFVPPSHTPWEEIQRTMVSQLDEGMVLDCAVRYHRVADESGVPRANY